MYTRGRLWVVDLAELSYMGLPNHQSKLSNDPQIWRMRSDGHDLTCVEIIGLLDPVLPVLITSRYLHTLRGP